MAFGQGIVAAVIRVLIDADTKGLNEGMSEAQRRTAAFTKNLDAAGRRMQSIGTRMTATVTLPIVGGMAAAFKAASDFNESMSKATVVFGDQAKEIRKWSKTSATAFGLSQQAALEAAGTYGNLFQAFGLGREESAKMSMSLVQLAADLASFNNTSVDDAILALRSGLSGETEPLKRFGVAINEARLTTEALAMGLIEEGEKMSVAAKAQAIYSLILKDTTLAQGDFARTSDGAANQMRILKAEFTNAAARIGRQLIPVGLQLLELVRGWLDSFAGMRKETQALILKLLGIAAVSGPFLKIAGVFLQVAAAIRKATLAVQVARTTAALGIAAQSTGTAGIGAAGAATGSVAAVAITALVAAIVGLTAVFVAHKAKLESDVQRIRDHSIALRDLSTETIGVAGGFRDVALNQARVAEVAKTYREQQTAIINQFAFLTDGMKSYADQVLNLRGLTVRQSERIAALISGIDRMGGSVDQLILKQASNLIAVGDVTGALKLLRQAASEAASNLDNVGPATVNPRLGMVIPMGNRVTTTTKAVFNFNLTLDRRAFNRSYDLTLRASGF